MEENITLVFRGFLNLTAKEKLKLVDEINRYFDSNDREPIRAQAEADFRSRSEEAAAKSCLCCGR